MLRNRWYPITEAARLRRKPIGLRRFGRSLVVWRDGGGDPRVLPAVCPHRGASLAGGRVIDGELECPWHGFRFDALGRCTRMPCEGHGARVPRMLNQRPFPVREAHALIWAWWGDERESYPAVPFFDEVADTRGFSQSSYVLPYHYSRMMETNLDVHHTHFVHGNLIPVGPRVIDFEAHAAGDRIYSSGTLVKEENVRGVNRKGTTFRADLLLPNLVLIELTPRLRILVCATPVDETHSWLWFRYYQTYTTNALLGKLITWISVQTELRIVQRQDWRIFADMTPGTIDDFPYGFVHTDKAIALYRHMRAAQLEVTP